MKNKVFFLLFSLLAPATFAQNKAAPDTTVRGREGNGGDGCERRFKEVRDDLRRWLEGGGAEQMQLPPKVSAAQYRDALLKYIVGPDTATVSCEDKTPVVFGAEKTCRNYFDEAGRARIECGSERYNKSGEDNQYITTHHEYAGLAGFEVNVGPESDYTYSGQTTAFLRNTVVKRLAIRGPERSEEKLPIDQLNQGTTLKFSVSETVPPFRTGMRLTSTKILTCDLYFDESPKARKLDGTVELILNAAPEFFRPGTNIYNFRVAEARLNGAVAYDVDRFNLEKRPSFRLGCARLGPMGSEVLIGDLRQAIEQIGGEFISPEPVEFRGSGE